jgi:hypothetical protein
MRVTRDKMPEGRSVARLRKEMPGHCCGVGVAHLTFLTASEAAHLELVGRRTQRHATMAAILGSDSQELVVTPVAGKPWGPGWTTPKDE